MRENTQFLVFWARLTSLRMKFSNSIHLPANDNISFFFMVFFNKVPSEANNLRTQMATALDSHDSHDDYKAVEESVFF
jgi:hypothetical protein